MYHSLKTYIVLTYFKNFPKRISLCRNKNNRKLKCINLTLVNIKLIKNTRFLKKPE